MTVQAIAGFGSEAIPASYALTNQRLGKQCYPSMQFSQKLSIKEHAKAQKDDEGEGGDFSGSLA